jgi:hypothetical protein
MTSGSQHSTSQLRLRWRGQIPAKEPRPSAFSGRAACVARPRALCCPSRTPILRRRHHQLITCRVRVVESLAVPLGFFASLSGILCTMFALRQRAATAAIATRIFNASPVPLVGLLAIHLGNPDEKVVKTSTDRPRPETPPIRPRILPRRARWKATHGSRYRAVRI